MKGKLLVTLAIAGVAGLQTASAGLILETFQQLSGTGLGAVNTILTIQSTPQETGCVSFGGVTGSTMSGGSCTGSSADVKTGASQTQTRTLAQAGITSADSFALIFNGVEPAGGAITVNNITASFYSPTGSVLYTTTGLFCLATAGGPITPAGAAGCTLNQTAQGTGNSGYLVVLDSAQRLAATAAGVFNNPSNVIGLSAAASNSQGGNETFFLANSTSVFPAPLLALPEPGTYALLGGGLVALALFRRRRHA